MIAMILPMAVMAQEEKDTTVVIPQSENTLRVAAELSKYGYANNDALSLLGLYVYDNNGNLIDKDDDYTDNCVCTWTPRWTGNFRIKIVNRGSVYNRYVLRTN